MGVKERLRKKLKDSGLAEEYRKWLTLPECPGCKDLAKEIKEPTRPGWYWLVKHEATMMCVDDDMNKIPEKDQKWEPQEGPISVLRDHETGEWEYMGFYTGDWRPLMPDMEGCSLYGPIWSPLGKGLRE